MPRVQVLIVFEGNHGESGQVLAQEVRDLLDNHGYVVVELDYQGCRPTEEELELMRWRGEGGKDD